MPLTPEQRIVRSRLSRFAQDYFDDHITPELSHEFCVFVINTELRPEALLDLQTTYETFLDNRKNAKDNTQVKSKLSKLQAMRIAAKALSSINIEEVQSFLSRVNTAADHDEIVDDYIAEVKAIVEQEIKKVLDTSKITESDFERVNAELKRELQESVSDNLASIDLDEPLGA